jgi:hypothetical protein
MKFATLLSGALLATVLSTGAMAQAPNATTEKCGTPAMAQDPRCVGTAPAPRAATTTTTTPSRAGATSTGVEGDSAECAKPSMKQDPRCVGANPTAPR